jgi:biopolymer transport protein ExbD
MRSVVVAIPVVLLLAGRQRNPATSAPSGHTQSEKPAVPEKNVIKVNVTAGGDITADGQGVALGHLAAKFADLKRAGGEVWYHRDNPAGEPHPNALEVIKLVTENHLPVRLAAEPDFSDAVDDQHASPPNKR